ncbi:MAG: ribonuclease HII [Anaerolineae bacterium]
MLEATWWCEGYRRVAGVDEVGRGALFGPVVAAAVVLPAGWALERIPGLRDSKLASRPQRERLYECVLAEAVSVAVGVCSAAIIDEIGIAPATLRAMGDALSGLASPAEMVIVDGLGPLPRGYHGCALVDADALCASTSAASIVAKVTRDRLVRSLAPSFPGYCLEANVGYGTAAHLVALATLGPSPLHRRTFAPVGNSITR